MKLTVCGISLFLALALTFGSISVYAQYRPPHDKPGPAVDRIFFRAFAQEVAAAEVEKGSMDIYIFNLKTAAAREFLGRPDIDIRTSPSTTVSLILNPSPPLPGELNPFTSKNIRFAMQYLVNRDFISSEIYRGLSTSMLTHVSPFDYDYLTIYDIVRKLNIRHDPEFAKKTISDELIKMGASLVDGRWTYRGQPVRLKFVIRVEDERLDIGNLIASELEKVGFTVDRVYQEFGPAISKVYGTDPSAFEWHLYTEGWGKVTLERYDFANINQMCAPWFGNMPGWQELGFKQYVNDALDALGQRIFKGDFASVQERDQLYRQATEECVKESVRLWLSTIITSSPSRKGIEGITDDLASGPRSLWALREAYIAGKNELTVGHRWVWTPTTVWNPVGGFGDVYSVDIWRNVFDPPIWRHPFTGLPIPFRVQYKVETAGPSGKLDVPSDAFVWDATAKGWKRVGSGVRATSKVSLNYESYLNSKWHHGQPITMADIIYKIHQSFDLAYNPLKSNVEYAIAAVNRPILDLFKGFKIAGPTTLEVYLDFWHFHPDYIAEFAEPFGAGMPWEILAAMDTLVFEKRQAAYSDTGHQKFNVPWLSLVEDQHARLVRNVLNEFQAKQSVPENVFNVIGQDLVTKQQASERYKASLAWFDEHKILVISNGPFMLDKFDPSAQFAELRAFREPTYPFKPGKWFFGKAQVITISSLQDKNILIGSDSSLAVELRGPGGLGAKYLLFNPGRGELIATGEAVKTGDTRFEIRLGSSVTSKLAPGTYQLYIAGFSDQISYVSERIELVEAVRTLPTRTGTPTVTQTPTTTQQVTRTEGEQATQSLLPIIIVVILVIVGVVAFVLRGRMSKKTSQ